MNVCEGLLRKRVDNRDILIFSAITESRSTSPIEVFQDVGYDGVLLDREHTALNTETISDQIRVARSLHFPCMVRVCEENYHELNRTLDQAADGLFIPRIRSREQVEKIIQTVKYAPEGIRGLGGYTCPVSKYRGWGNVVDQITTVNKNLVIGIQIETAEALADLDGILSVKGVGYRRCRAGRFVDQFGHSRGTYEPEIYGGGRPGAGSVPAAPCDAGNRGRRSGNGRPLD